MGKFARVEGPGPNPTYSLMEDRDGAIWAGGGNGQLWRWRDGAWQRFDPDARFARMRASQRSPQGGDGTLWVCAGSSGLYRAQRRAFRAGD